MLSTENLKALNGLVVYLQYRAFVGRRRSQTAEQDFAVAQVGIALSEIADLNTGRSATVQRLDVTGRNAVGGCTELVRSAVVSDELVVKQRQELLVVRATVETEAIDTELKVATVNHETSSTRDTRTGSDTGVTEVVQGVVEADVLGRTYEQEVVLRGANLVQVLGQGGKFRQQNSTVGGLSLSNTVEGNVLVQTHGRGNRVAFSVSQRSASTIGETGDGRYGAGDSGGGGQATEHKTCGDIATELHQRLVLALQHVERLAVPVNFHTGGFLDVGDGELGLEVLDLVDVLGDTPPTAVGRVGTFTVCVGEQSELVVVRRGQVRGVHGLDGNDVGAVLAVQVTNLAVLEQNQVASVSISIRSGVKSDVHGAGSDSRQGHSGEQVQLRVYEVMVLGHCGDNRATGQFHDVEERALFIGDVEQLVQNLPLVEEGGGGYVAFS